MRRVWLAFIVSISLMAGLGIVAMAQGPVPDCIYIASTAGAGVVPAGSEGVVCRLALGGGNHALELGWSLGATGTATIDVAETGGSGRFRLRCAVLGGVSQCHTSGTVPFDAQENPFQVLGPFEGQRTATIVLTRPGTVTFSAGPYTYTFVCPVNDACVRAVLAEGILGLTVNEGYPVNCLILPCFEPCQEPPAEAVPAGEGSSPSPTPTATGPEPPPCPGPTDTAQPTASPSPTS